MNFPVLKTEEAKNNLPILIVDKIGAIGEELAKQFSSDFLVVLLSPNPVEAADRKIIHIPFKKRIPQVPDNNYSKIFIVDDGNLVTRESAFSFIEKAKETDSPLYFIGSLRNIDIKHSDQVVASYNKAKVLIFGDLFDKNIFFGEASINKFILQARKSGKIKVDGNGLSLSFPVTFADTIKLIIKASYLEISQSIILLFPPHPITDISLANIFKKINPDISVDFGKEKKESEIYIPHGAQHAISKYDLEKKIRELDLEDVENRQLKVIGKEVKRKSPIKPLIVFLLILLFTSLLPFLTTSVYALLGEREIKNTRASAGVGNFDKSAKQIKNSKTFFGIALKTSELLVWEAKLIGMEKNAKAIRKRMQAGLMISEAGVHLLDASFLVRDIYSGKSRNPKDDFSKASNLLKSAVSLIQKTKAEGELPQDLSEEFDSISPFIDLFSNSADILPDILGFEEEKSYLVLLQDESNLRPGGGTIESFAVLKLRNSKITDLSLFESIWLDERIDSKIEPPFMLARYSEIDSLTLKNNSTEPDFINNAISASNIYFLGTKEKVDGVIALDYFFIKNLLSQTGSVEVGGEKITNENLFEARRQQASLGKKDFMANLAESIKKYFEERSDISYFELTKKIGKSVREKHLLFASPNASYQNIFTANGWSSSLWDSREKQNNKINDYVGISEANLGDSTNDYISRSVSKKTIITDKGKISSLLSIGFKNNSNQNNKLGGDYKNYIQLILPEGTKISSIEVDGKKANIKKSAVNSKINGLSNINLSSELEILERNQMDKSIFGFFITVPSASIRTVRVMYDLPYSTSVSLKSFNYSVKAYKQPGIDSYPLDLIFDLSKNFRVLPIERISTELKEDQIFDFTIAQK